MSGRSPSKHNTHTGGASDHVFIHTNPNAVRDLRCQIPRMTRPC